MKSDALTFDGGLIRLFPLPNLVFFPGAMQPLHIFEPRYRQMTADALAGDRLIALVLPKPGWETTYAGSPPIHAVACVGTITSEQCLDDGRFNILLHGVQRMRIIEEVPQAKLYRTARAEALHDAAAGSAEAPLLERLREEVPRWFAKHTELCDQLLQLVADDLGLGRLVDVLAFVLPLDAEFKQTLLEEPEVTRRAERLLHHVAGSRFPPEFSPN